MKRVFFVSIYSFLFFLSSCSNPGAIFSPYSYAPESPDSAWLPATNKSMLISSKYCEMLLPRDFMDNEISLGELIDIALHNNPDTKITWAEARSKAALFGQSMSTYFPELVGTGSYTRQRSTFSLSGDLTVPFLLTTITPELTLTYTLLDFGQRRNSSEAARQTLFYADWMHNQEIQNVIQLVMDDYYDYLFEVQQLAAFEADLESATTTLDAAKQKFHFGVADLGDVSQAKTKYLQAKINVIGEKRMVENAFAKLVKDIGLPANMEFEVQPLPERVFVDVVLESVETLIKEAQHQRQDLHAMLADVRSKEAEVAYAKSLYYPVFTSDVDFGRNWYGHGEHEDYHWTVTFKMTLPIFRGFYYRNKVKYAKANLEKSAGQLLQKELSVVEEVTTAHYDVGSAAETLLCSEDYLKQAEEQFDIALEYYKAGTNTILDVLSAQASLADARSKLADSKKTWYTSLANLAYSTGALCSVPQESCKMGAL